MGMYSKVLEFMGLGWILGLLIGGMVATSAHQWSLSMDGWSMESMACVMVTASTSQFPFLFI